MPPNRRSRANNPARIDSAVLDTLTVPEFRNLCREKKLLSTGNRNTLLTRLRGSAFVIPAQANDRTLNQPAQCSQNSNATTALLDHAANDNNFTEGQLNGLRRLVQEFVAAAAREITNEAATAAVQTLQSASPTTTRTLAVISDITPTDQEQPESFLHASPFQDIPASYVKDIQSSEFFQLSKLLPKNLATVEDEDNLVLILNNSVVWVSKKSKTVNSIAEIEQWRPPSPRT